MKYYTGRVLNNVDDEGFGRIKINVPELHGNTNSGTWADLCLPFRSFTLPAVGEFVWCTTVEGPLSSGLLCFGWKPCKSIENYAHDISEEPGTAAEYEIKEGLPGGVDLAETKARPVINTPDLQTALNTPGGIRFFANDDLDGSYDLSKIAQTLPEAFKKSIAKLDKSRNFDWGFEDPLGNKISFVYYKGNCYFTVKSLKGAAEAFELTHDTQSKELSLKDSHGNRVLLTNGKLVLKSSKEIYIGDESGAEPIPLGTKLKTYFDSFIKVFTDWVPSSMDGGAALNAAIKAWQASHANDNYLSTNNKVNT